MPFALKRLAALATLAAVTGLLPACNSLSRLASIGEEPPLTEIQNPGATRSPVVMPMPQPAEIERESNSIWRPGARAFFKDQRAALIGDILTVTINIADAASLSNTSGRTRANTESAAAPNILGVDVGRFFGKVGGNNADPASLVNLSSNTSNTGTGTIGRTESITLRVAAVVTQVLPNGNLVIRGSQEVRVNYETRVLQLAGVIRPQDIRSDNQIPYDRIAEARIAYGGRGQLTDVQQPRWGQQLYDVIFPF